MVPEHAPPPHLRRRRVAHGPESDDPSDGRALHFARWFLHSKYRLMAGFEDELAREDPPEPALLHARFRLAVRHAERVETARAVVTFLLAFGIIAAAGSTVANLLEAPRFLEGDIATTTLLMDRIAALSASLSVVLVGLRLLFDRYLDRVDVAAIFLGMQMAASRRVKP